MAEYEIGLTQETMVTLKSLGIKKPEPDPGLAADSTLTMSRKVKSIGSPTDAWHWGFLYLDKRNTLRNTYCPDKSAFVYIRTDGNDGEWHLYHCLMVWPDHERQQAGRVLDFNIDFLFLVEIEEEVS